MAIAPQLAYMYLKTEVMFKKPQTLLNQAKVYFEQIKNYLQVCSDKVGWSPKAKIKA